MLVWTECRGFGCGFSDLDFRSLGRALVTGTLGSINAGRLGESRVSFVEEDDDDDDIDMTSAVNVFGVTSIKNVLASTLFSLVLTRGLALGVCGTTIGITFSNTLPIMLELLARGLADGGST